MRPRLTVILIVLVLVVFSVTSASAEILLCISKNNLKGEKTVGSGVAKGELFARVEKYGLVWILIPEEIALTMASTPRCFSPGPSA